MILEMKNSISALLALVSISAVQASSLITLNFSGEMSGVQQQTFTDAANYWNTAITGYDLSTNYLGQAWPHGLTISASVPYIDGVGGILGSAGPDTATYYDNNPTGTPTVALYYSTTGAMQFDSADVNAMVANNTFYGVVLHEMAHVLGIGTLWTLNSNVEGTTYNLYTAGSGQYVGPNALAKYRTEFNMPSATYVPVEMGGGAGTAEGHWNEVNYGAGNTGIVSNLTGLDFANELMTGWASNTFFVSQVTLGALDDLGYVVDYSKAGIVNYVASVPEWSSLALGLGVLPWALMLRRRG